VLKAWAVVVLNKKILLLILTALLCLGFRATIQADERLYILDNLIVNGQFDTNVNGYTANSNSVLSWDDGTIKQDITYLGTVNFYASGSPVGISGHIYYVAYDITINDKTYINDLRLYMGNWVTVATASELVVGTNHISSYITDTTNTFIHFALNTNSATNFYVNYDNIIYIDLTATFGGGFEPSLADFELYYLPDGGWFDSYETLEPESYNYYQLANYSHLGSDLTSLDYSKSIIDNYGDNVDLQIYAYVYDTGPTAHTYDIWWYTEFEHPYMVYLGKTYTFNWVVSDYSRYVMYLEMTDEENEILKRILFNREIDVDNEYFTFNVTATNLSYTNIWLELTSTFRLNVDIESILLSRKTVTDNDFNLVNYMYYKFYDRHGDLLLPSLKFNIGDTFRTVLVNDFGSNYTDISQFRIALDVASPDEDDTYTLESHYFYELGIFSSSDVLFVNDIDTDIDNIFESEICNWYDVVCGGKNLVNDMWASIYNKLRIADIIDSFDNIYDKVNTVVSILPAGVKAIAIVIIVSSLGVIALFIVDRL